MGFVNFLKGILIGIALVVPGLSGSIFMVVVGLYDKVMDAITTLLTKLKKNTLFLLPIVIGIGVGILASTKGVLFIYERFTWQSSLFFIGLILGSIPLIVRKMHKKQDFKPIYILVAVVCFIMLTAASNMIFSGTDESYIAIRSISSISEFITIVWAGLFSCSLMMIPGVSGSVNLMVIGQYGTIYNAAGSIVDALRYLLIKDMTAFNEAISSAVILLPFILGAVIGIGLIAKLLTFLLKKYEAYVYYGVFGIVCACVVSLLRNGVLNKSIDFSMPLVVGISALCIVSGVVLTFALKTDEK